MNKSIRTKSILKDNPNIQATPIVFPKRYLHAQKSNLTRKIKKLYKEQPTLPAKVALIQLFKPLPDFIPAAMLQELCLHTLQSWANMQK